MSLRPPGLSEPPLPRRLDASFHDISTLRAAVSMQGSALAQQGAAVAELPSILSSLSELHAEAVTARSQLLDLRCALASALVTLKTNADELGSYRAAARELPAIHAALKLLQAEAAAARRPGGTAGLPAQQGGGDVQDGAWREEAGVMRAAMSGLEASMRGVEEELEDVRAELRNAGLPALRAELLTMAAERAELKAVAAEQASEEAAAVAPEMMPAPQSPTPHLQNAAMAATPPLLPQPLLYSAVAAVPAKAWRVALPPHAAEPPPAHLRAIAAVQSSAPLPLRLPGAGAPRTGAPLPAVLRGGRAPAGGGGGGGSGSSSGCRDSTAGAGSTFWRDLLSEVGGHFTSLAIDGSGRWAAAAALAGATSAMVLDPVSLAPAVCSRSSKSAAMERAACILLSALGLPQAAPLHPGWPGAPLKAATMNAVKTRGLKGALIEAGGQVLRVEAVVLRPGIVEERKKQGRTPGKFFVAVASLRGCEAAGAPMATQKNAEGAAAAAVLCKLRLVTPALAAECLL